jgi:glycerol uptake facilitator-like aquaporin
MIFSINMLSPALVEFLGTALLIGTVSFTGVPVLIVAALAIAIGLGGKVSGGHFNPAVTAWALLSGKIDGMVFSSAPEGLLIQMLLQTPGIRLFSFSQAEAYSRRFPFLGLSCSQTFGI